MVQKGMAITWPRSSTVTSLNACSILFLTIEGIQVSNGGGQTLTPALSQREREDETTFK
jgi:hypothetical protein